MRGLGRQWPLPRLLAVLVLILGPLTDVRFKLTIHGL